MHSQFWPLAGELCRLEGAACDCRWYTVLITVCVAIDVALSSSMMDAGHGITQSMHMRVAQTLSLEQVEIEGPEVATPRNKRGRGQAVLDAEYCPSDGIDASPETKRASTSCRQDHHEDNRDAYRPSNRHKLRCVLRACIIWRCCYIGHNRGREASARAAIFL
jgi:hypothetical protein